MACPILERRRTQHGALASSPARPTPLRGCRAGTGAGSSAHAGAWRSMCEHHILHLSVGKEREYPSRMPVNSMSLAAAVFARARTHNCASAQMRVKSCEVLGRRPEGTSLAARDAQTQSRRAQVRGVESVDETVEGGL